MDVKKTLILMDAVNKPVARKSSDGPLQQSSTQHQATEEKENEVDLTKVEKISTELKKEKRKQENPEEKENEVDLTQTEGNSAEQKKDKRKQENPEEKENEVDLTQAEGNSADNDGYGSKKISFLLWNLNTVTRCCL